MKEVRNLGKNCDSLVCMARKNGGGVGKTESQEVFICIASSSLKMGGVSKTPELEEGCPWKTRKGNVRQMYTYPRGF